MNELGKNIFLLIALSFICNAAIPQALGTSPEEGRGTYKNRVFFNLERYWDSTSVCNNPHKGWCIHYYDNSIRNYGNRLAPDDSLPDFPGLNDIYLRLAWSYLEPEEGQFNWALLDSIINRWTRWGHTISFRITCKETEMVYATPEWVRKAGARGEFIEHPDLELKAWAPDYGDPVFLEKLEQFHRVFAARYDGKPWIEYIDIGSIGEWGEGHTAFSGWKDVSPEVVKKHIDLYKRCYRKSILIISDDFIGQRDSDDGSDYEIYRYCLQNGLGFRDDSGNVAWYRTLGFGPSCIRSPEIFSKVYRSVPVVLESDHYGDAVKLGMWGDGSGFEKAIRETHASVIGFHYYPREWLKDNYALASRLANLCGYWYFPKFAMMPDTLRLGSDRNYIRITWENHGVAPAYKKFNLYFRLVNLASGVAFTQQLAEADNRSWLPADIIAEQYSLRPDKTLPSGKYAVLISMFDACGFHNRIIKLALKKERETSNGWYKLGEIMVKQDPGMGREIWTPVFTGTPPDNAFNGLVQLPDGELRHYGFEGPWFTPTAHLYIYSWDNGLTWKREVITDSSLFTNENMPPAVCSPYSGDFIRLVSTQDGTFVMLSRNMEGPYERIQIHEDSHNMIRQPVFLKSCRRILVTCERSLIQRGREVIQSCVFYSDDDGYHWKRSLVPIGPAFKTAWPHEKPRWQNYAIEPTIAELGDGKIWMLLRTSMDQFYESWSVDHGSTWTVPVPSRFYSTLTMPTFFRLKDGRLLLFFCSTTPLPEIDRSKDTTIREEQKNGLWEDVFTNRDVIHVAISANDGKTWIGFRELYLNPLRNESDFATRGGKEVSLDKSVHQSQAFELPDGKILVALGQHPLVRRMVVFDPGWLYETQREDDFSNGLVNWSTHKYLKGIKGHCAYNRDPGASLVDHPSGNGKKVLQIRHVKNPELVCDVDGAVWNFPAALKGTFTTRIYLVPGGWGGRISLTDRWFNPTDTLAWRFAMFSLKFDGSGNTSDGNLLKPGEWNDVTFEWTNLQEGTCRLIINGKLCPKGLPINFPSTNGINYVHFLSITENEDSEGYLIESVKGLNRGIDQ
jgi:hypothetical protein